MTRRETAIAMWGIFTATIIFWALIIWAFFVAHAEAYEGVISTRNQLLEAVSRSSHSANSRATAYTFQTVGRLRVVLQNFITDEKSVGCAVTYTGAIEYPVGTYSQLLFNGVPQVTLPDISIQSSDYLTLPVPIAPGTPFWTHLHAVSPCGIPYQGIMFSHGRVGDSFQVCACYDLPDNTMGGLGGGTSINGFIPPIAVLGETSLPSYVAWGDSIEWGAGIQPLDDHGNVGPVSRSLGTQFAHIKFARSGEAMWVIVAGNNTIRRSLLKYASASVNALGANDFVGRGGPAMAANSQTIAGWSQAAFPGGQQFAIAFTMRDRSTTGQWTTLAEQYIAATPGQEQSRINYNTGCRAGFPWLTGCFDIAAQVESSLNSGKWRVDKGRETADGVHPMPLGASDMANGYVAKQIHYP